MSVSSGDIKIGSIVDFIAEHHYGFCFNHIEVLKPEIKTHRGVVVDIYGYDPIVGIPHYSVESEGKCYTVSLSCITNIQP